MINSVENLRGYKIRATDGDLGKVEDFYFDDESWTVRYVVVDTGSWLPGRQVLISPASVSTIHHDDRAVAVNLDKRQVANAPDIDTHKPVDRQQETEMARYYGWPLYWSSEAYIPVGVYAPPPVSTGAAPAAEQPVTAERAGPNLRSASEVVGYHIQAADDEIGHVDDFLLDNDWVIRYMAVDTRNFLPGKKVLLSPAWIQAIRWAERKVYVDAAKDLIKSSPAWDEKLPVSRDYELALFRHYGRKEYWPAA